ncbi:muscle M-line assembly protein unc-89 isoform X10 [Spodoptera frugiperda]|uniref:Muscle M-line assembly protein unc-89 isoform X10 n=1 Tax=Spodoptera frugiperda TaxID=7108 RepID=A0A9R0DPX6_SPOFR|nr:muscle M-line assembly protein unc-89 isoform X10 [Spodoptera frugiperda]
MPNEEVLGPRKTMFVLVIVVGCFAVLWPRILSPLITGPSGEQLKPNKFDREAAIKQERPLIRGAGPHPALRERGRAIPPGVPSSPTKSSVAMPPHVRVRSSPLSVYYDLDIKPPPIPGMRPPLGSPGGPVPTPKSSMGFVMPIYTICIIVFFVYTISKILFRRTASSSPYETLPPDPQFRRRVFRDDSRSTPDKLVVTAISGLVAEVQEQMEASYAQNQQRQDAQDNNARPYTNGTILHNSGPVHIVASEYKEPTKESLEKKEPSPAPEEPKSVPEQTQEEKEPSPEPETQKPVEKEPSPEPDTQKPVEKEPSPEPETQKPVEKEPSPEPETQKPVEEQQQAEKPEEPAKEESLPQKESTPEKDTQVKEPTPEPKEPTPEVEDQKEEEKEIKEVSPEKVAEETNDTDKLIKLADDVKVERNGDVRHTEEFIKEEAKASEAQKEKQSTPELLEEAIKDDDEQENASVKVVGMEVRAHPADGGAWRAKRPTETPPPIPAAAPAPQRAHEAEQVQSIYLDTEIPQQSRVLVADFAEKRTDRPAPTKHSPMVVSGKMTLSLIQDAPRDTPERDQESTVDDFTTASAVTQNAEKEGESEEEIEEEIEIEEIEEEVEEEEEEEEAVEVDQKDKKTE